MIDPERQEQRGEDAAPNRGPDRKQEQALLNRARAGEADAFGLLIRTHQDRVYGLVRRLVGDEALAEEVTQDVFVKAYRGLHRFRGEARFSTWLYRIAVNLSHDHRQSSRVRHMKRETSLDHVDGVRGRPAGSHTRPDHTAEAARMAEVFEAGLRALDGKYREAFLLRHQEGLEYGEIAEVLEISPANAKVRVHRARETILGVLRSRGYEV